MKDDFSTYVKELKSCMIIIKNVPCLKCEQCGETVYSDEVQEQLDKIINIMETNLTQVTVVNYLDKVA